MPLAIRADYLDLPAEGGLLRVHLATPAWYITDLSDLDELPKTRGKTREIPGRPGTYSVGPDEIDEAVLAFAMVLRGDVSQEGIAYSDYRTGWNTNSDYWRANLRRPPATTDGLRACSWVRSGRPTLAARIKVTDFAVGPISHYTATGVLTMTVPAGEFV